MLVFAQAAGEYGGAEGGLIGVVVQLFATVYDTVSNAVADHPVLWGIGACMTVWLLVRRR